MILTNSGVLKLMQRIKSYIASQLNTKAASVHTHTISEIDDLSSLQMGGGYTKSEVDTLLSNKADSVHTHTTSDITDFPTIPSKTSDLTNDNGFITGVTWNDVTNKPTLATVATSGSYNDLDNKPTIPTVNNATLKIQKNGTDVKTFTANASTDVTCNITVPTKVSELSNDSGFLTSHQSLTNYSTLANTIKALSISGKTITVTPGSGDAYTLTTQDTVYTHPTTAGNKHIPSGGSANQYLKYSASGTAVWANLPTIPSKTSQLTNDSGYLTSHQSLANYVTLNTAQTITATKTISANLNFSTTYTRGTAPSSSLDKELIDYRDSADNRIGLFESTVFSDKSSLNAIYAYNTSVASGGNIGYIGIGSKANGSVFTYAPTPGASDNSTQIATTAWVTSKGYLTSHQSLSNYSTLANTIKSLSISGKTITYTKGDNSTGTLTTQDTNTTYSNFVKSGSGAKAGLVPAPSTTAGTTKYLREDGTWQVPPDHTYTVNNATLTIQKNGSNVATFTSNASSNVTCNITVPTKTSELTNNSGFLTSHQSLSGYVPKSGGAVMTGNTLCRTVNNDEFRLDGGTGGDRGASVILAGKDQSYAGRLRLAASDGSRRSVMTLAPDGGWAWDGQAVELTSDQRLKQQINKIDTALLDAWEDVDLVQFKYNDAVDQKGDNARLHTGYVVQQIDEACQKHDVDISAYGLYCHEVYPEETEEVEIEQEDGTIKKETKVVREASEHYSLRYTETLVVECSYLRRENTRLKTRLDTLENRLEQLEQYLK